MTHFSFRIALTKMWLSTILLINLELGCRLVMHPLPLRPFLDTWLASIRYQQEQYIPADDKDQIWVCAYRLIAWAHDRNRVTWYKSRCHLTHYEVLQALPRCISPRPTHCIGRWWIFVLALGQILTFLKAIFKNGVD